MRLIIAAGLVLLFSAAAKADDLTTGDAMLPACKQFIEQGAMAFRNGFCFGSVRALSQMADGDTVCPPESSIPAQKIRVVVSYMEKHPEMLRLDFNVLALLALSEAWPCKRKP